jgi:hypothetical protein
VGARGRYYHFLKPGDTPCYSVPIHVASWLQKVHSISFAQSILLHSGELSLFHAELCGLTGIRPREEIEVTTESNSINAVRLSKTETRADYLASALPLSGGRAADALPLLHLPNQVLVVGNRVHGLRMPPPTTTDSAETTTSTNDGFASADVPAGGLPFTFGVDETQPTHPPEQWWCESCNAYGMGETCPHPENRQTDPDGTWWCAICSMKVCEESCPFCDNSRGEARTLADDDAGGGASSASGERGDGDSSAGALGATRSAVLAAVPTLTVSDVERYVQQNNASSVPMEKLLERGRDLASKGDIPLAQLKDAENGTVGATVYPNIPKKRYAVELTFRRKGEARSLQATAHGCSCPQGERTTLCKHAVGLLYSLAGIIGPSKSDNGNAAAAAAVVSTGTRSAAAGRPAGKQAAHHSQGQPTSAKVDEKRSLNFLNKQPAKETARPGPNRNAVTPAQLREWATGYLASKSKRSKADNDRPIGGGGKGGGGRRKVDTGASAATHRGATSRGESGTDNKRRRVDPSSSPSSSRSSPTPPTPPKLPVVVAAVAAAAVVAPPPAPVPAVAPAIRYDSALDDYM